MPPAMSLVVELHPVDVRTGLWCPACSLPSGVHMAALAVLASTLRVIGRVTRTWCNDCGRQLEASA